MRATEFTQPQAAGCIIVAEDTGRWCLQQRSDSVSDPGVWSTWGGGREPGESLEQCARRELAEESGYSGPIKLEPLAKNAKYVTFIGVVPHEFEPTPCDEWKDYCWVELGRWPGPLHPGLRSALSRLNQSVAEAQEKFNRAIMQPGFEFSQEIDGVTYEVTNDQGRGPVVTVTDKNNEVIAQAGFEKHKTRPGLESLNTYVEPAWQGQGIAANMYAVIRMLGANISPSTNQTDDGQAMWDKWDKQGDTKHIKSLNSKFDEKGMAENFADGKNPQDKGDSKRHGVPTKASVSTLRKVAKQGGRKGQLAHWMANMKAGRAKAKKK